MARLKGFTLIETLIAAIIITTISGLSVLIYLNVTQSMISLDNFQMRKIGESYLDSLSGNFPGVSHDEIFTDEGGLIIDFNKAIYENDSTLFNLKITVTDTFRNMQIDYEKLSYEP